MTDPLLGLSLGWDNVAVAFALGPVLADRRAAARLGALFGICEIASSLLGAAIAPAAVVGLAATLAAMTVTAGVGICGVLLVRRDPRSFANNGWAPLALALLLALDNMVGGAFAEPGAMSVLAAAIGGVLTGMLSFIACEMGSRLAGHLGQLPRRLLLGAVFGVVAATALV